MDPVSLAKITKLIVHEIPKNYVGGAQRGPMLSDIESPLDADVRSFFEGRLQQTLGNSFMVEFRPAAPTTKLLTEEYLSKRQDFVEYSRNLANHLFSVQTGTSSPGLLCVAACKQGGNHSVAMLKLEKEEGLRVDTQSVAGRTTLSVLHVRDLMLTNKTRVFKAALIAEEDDKLVAWACDEQRKTGEYLAEFFLSKFLGVRLVAKPEVLTRDFMDAVESWITNEIPDPETKVRYHVALMAEMNSNRTTITPNAFANEHLAASEREPFLAHISDKGALTKRFPKNIQLVQGRLRRIQFNLSGQISLICPPDAVGDNVKITTDPDGMALIWAKGELQGVKGRAR